MRKIFQYILMAVAVVVTASCSNDIDETLHPAGNGAIQFVVSDFPAFGESGLTRAIGTQDEGKTAWENGDQIIVTLTSQKYGEQAAALTYDGSSWSTEASLSYLENETPTISAVYAPCYEVTEEGVKQLRSGMQLGMCEYLEAACEIEYGTINISFDGAHRTYSRLRIAAMPEATLIVTTTDFTPAGATSEATEAYTLTADDKGNAYLYGVFAEEATVSVKQGEVTLKDYIFTADKNPNGTEHNKSYALDATPVIDGTLGGKATAEESDITALMEKLKDYVANGITTIIITGAEPAIIDMYLWTNTAIGEAIYRLSGGDEDYDENNPYNGKIDLILSDVTEIVDQEYYNAFALNSITLPKVTTIGDEAFYGCYHLKQITFGSEVTSVGEDAFVVVVVERDCELVLNKDQVAVEGLAPDFDSRTWAGHTWKSITLK